MLRTVAISSARSYTVSKRDALLFDQILLLGLDYAVPCLPALYAAEVDWLIEHGVVAGLSIDGTTIAREAPPHIRNYRNAFHAFSLATAAIQSSSDLSLTRDVPASLLADAVATSPAGPYVDTDVVGEVAARVLAGLPSAPADSAAIKKIAAGLCRVGDDYASRFAARIVQTQPKTEAIPLLITEPEERHLFPGERIETVVQLVISALPTPDEATPWEAIVDFRADETAMHSLRRMRRWIRGMASSSRPVAEIEEELEYLLIEYERSMQLHRMKTNRGTLETFLTVVGEAFLTAAGAGIGSGLSALFVARDRKLSLLQAEQTASGRDVGYVALARDHFQRGGA
jgi:hypothetical protein